MFGTFIVHCLEAFNILIIASIVHGGTYTIFAFLIWTFYKPVIQLYLVGESKHA